jgi:alpha-methylacyl-CoA racemase
MVALRNREKTGKGQRVDVAMTDSVMPLLTLQLAQYWGSQGNKEIINFLDGSFPFYGVYECADGKHVSLGALEQGNFGQFLSNGEQTGMAAVAVSHGEEVKVREGVAVCSRPSRVNGLSSQRFMTSV